MAVNHQYLYLGRCKFCRRKIVPFFVVILHPGWNHLYDNSTWFSAIMLRLEYERFLGKFWSLFQQPNSLHVHSCIGLSSWKPFFLLRWWKLKNMYFKNTLKINYIQNSTWIYFVLLISEHISLAQLSGMHHIYTVTRITILRFFIDIKSLNPYDLQ